MRALSGCGVSNFLRGYREIHEFANDMRNVLFGYVDGLLQVYVGKRNKNLDAVKVVAAPSAIWSRYPQVSSRDTYMENNATGVGAPGAALG